MSRPRNLLVSRGSSITAVSPKALKSFLTSLSSGSNDVTLDGKFLGNMTLDLSNLTPDTARTMLNRMFPEGDTKTSST